MKGEWKYAPVIINMYLMADVSLAVLSDSAPETTSGSSSSDTPITDRSLFTSSSEALYSLSSPWTASATLGKGLGGGGEGGRGGGAVGRGEEGEREGGGGEGERWGSRG